MPADEYLTLDDLEAAGVTPADVHEQCPWAVEYTALDGRPCWPREDLALLFGDTDEDDRPAQLP
jgi:hypothetical protein